MPMELVSQLRQFTPFFVNNLHLDLDKEQWEPTLTALFRSQKAGKLRVRLREAWALDSLTHGDSALLNGQLLENGRGIGISIHIF